MHEDYKSDSLIYDVRPKRRDIEENPYELSSGTDEHGQKHYFAEFIDGSGCTQCAELSAQIFAAMDAFELEDLSQDNKADRHLDGRYLNEEQLCSPDDTEAAAIYNVQVSAMHYAMDKLTEVQRRRVRMYFYQHMTYQQIAEKEGCTITPVRQSIEAAKKFLKNFCEGGSKNGL